MTATIIGTNSVDAWEQLTEASFEKGGEDELDGLRAKYPSKPEEGDQRKKLEQDWRDLLSKIRIQTGTLLKTDTASFLLGISPARFRPVPILVGDSAHAGSPCAYPHSVPTPAATCKREFLLD